MWSEIGQFPFIIIGHSKSTKSREPLFVPDLSSKLEESYSSVREDLSRTFTLEVVLRELLGPVFLLPRTGLAVISAFG